MVDFFSVKYNLLIFSFKKVDRAIYSIAIYIEETTYIHLCELQLSG